MARHSVKSEAVQALIRDVLVPLYVRTGSVAGITKILNDALRAASEDRPLHPNRIQALLSDDVARGVNELTIELLERAVAGLDRAGMLASAIERDVLFHQLLERAAPYLAQNALDATELAQRLGVPPGVLRLALDSTGSPPSTGPSAASSPHADRRPEPDWSYQDVAVARCLDALRRRPNGNIGLVLPTGAGKTRTAFRIILEVLARATSSTSRVVWLTHRRTLRGQAYRELQKLMQGAGPDLPDEAAQLANRVTFAMVSEISSILQGREPPCLVVVDEAHHAAAVSYRLVFEAAHNFPVLLLTATPNRTDRLPIGLDEIAYTITYRELAERGAILVPEFEPIAVKGHFAWPPSAIADLADRLVNEAADRFTKTLLLATKIEQVIAFYDAILARIAVEPDHPLKPDDIGFIHGSGNSHGLENDEFLARFAMKPRGLLISAQMLLEGFDDPAIDAVVITYRTESVIKLMQAVGRCVRYAPGKRRAYVLQADNPEIAYRFDQRWLYQEIDDYLRPDLDDLDYTDKNNLLTQAAQLLDAHHVSRAHRSYALRELADVTPGDQPRLLFYGLPYYGERDRFAESATWGVFVETTANSRTFRLAFNRFSELGALHSDPGEYLAAIGPEIGLQRDLQTGGLWRRLVEALTAAYYAREELYGVHGVVQEGRPFRAHGATTWLRYRVFRHQAHLPADIKLFLTDCHNRVAVEAAYLDDPAQAAMIIKTPMPLGACEAVLLDRQTSDELVVWLGALRNALRLVEPARQFEQFAALCSVATPPRLPQAHLVRLEGLLSDHGTQSLSLRLNASNPRKTP